MQLLRFQIIAERKIEFLADHANEDHSHADNNTTRPGIDRNIFLGNLYNLHKSSQLLLFLGKRRLALLDLMFEAQLKGEEFDDAGIKEETETFMFGVYALSLSYNQNEFYI